MGINNWLFRRATNKSRNEKNQDVILIPTDLNAYGGILNMDPHDVINYDGRTGDEENEESDSDNSEKHKYDERAINVSFIALHTRNLPDEIGLEQSMNDYKANTYGTTKVKIDDREDIEMKIHKESQSGAPTEITKEKNR